MLNYAAHSDDVDAARIVEQVVKSVRADVRLREPKTIKERYNARGARIRA